MPESTKTIFPSTKILKYEPAKDANKSAQFGEKLGELEEKKQDANRTYAHYNERQRYEYKHALELPTSRYSEDELCVRSLVPPLALNSIEV